ncbi:OmpA family protein [Sphingobacterium sp. N143]|uniref:OmpA family protein n=1 Tax=Sphingobacterium sp. N143 TaxID=2746727 RepID=UPI00257525D2|nr:OmpA family protein [Sphingobacterium sp. N143]MDM1296314.1 OmpA family protein [Sphingobacterium sp. N143]
MNSSLKPLALCSILLSMLFTACNNGNNKNKTETGTQTDSTETSAQPQTEVPAAEKGFDISSIPVSEQELGPFPFFSFPEGLEEQNKPIQRKFDRIYFPIDGKMTAIEGKVWKTNVTVTSGNYDDWSLPFFEKSYDEAIKAVGGVKIFDGEISQEEYDRYHKEATYLGEEGSIGYTGQKIKVYAIHRADGADIYIQLTGNTAGGYLNILQKEAFKQTITMLKSDQIQKELDEKGKAVLYINFDVDKASLKPDGKDAVAEIIKVLQKDSNLKISIEGHTDDTGNATHNQKLSESRAATVMDELIKAGINTSRLKAVGYGAEKPLVANDSEDNKAKNRRVELVKMNP